VSLNIQSPFGDVLIMRHALAPGGGDPDNFDLNDCSTQRNLDSEGRQQVESGKERCQGVEETRGV